MSFVLRSIHTALTGVNAMSSPIFRPNNTAETPRDEMSPLVLAVFAFSPTR